MRRVLLLSQSKPNLRIPELVSLNTKIQNKAFPTGKSVLLQDLHDTDVDLLSARAISVQKIYNLHADAENYDSLFDKLSSVDFSEYHYKSLKLETVRINSKNKKNRFKIQI